MSYEKEKILNYVSKTPYNTNRAVLSGMLDALVEQGDTIVPKTEIELIAHENKIYTPDEGKVYNKVTVDVPTEETFDSATFNITRTSSAISEDDLIVIFPYYDETTGSLMIYNDSITTGTYTVPVTPVGTVIAFPNIDWSLYEMTITGNNLVPSTDNNNFFLKGDESIIITTK